MTLELWLAAPAASSGSTSGPWQARCSNAAAASTKIGPAIASGRSGHTYTLTRAACQTASSGVQVCEISGHELHILPPCLTCPCSCSGSMLYGVCAVVLTATACRWEEHHLLHCPSNYTTTLLAPCIQCGSGCHRSVLQRGWQHASPFISISPGMCVCVCVCARAHARVCVVGGGGCGGRRPSHMATGLVVTLM